MQEYHADLGKLRSVGELCDASRRISRSSPPRSRAVRGYLPHTSKCQASRRRSMLDTHILLFDFMFDFCGHAA